MGSSLVLHYLHTIRASCLLVPRTHGPSKDAHALWQRPGWASICLQDDHSRVGTYAVGTPEPSWGSRVCPQSALCPAVRTQDDGSGLLIAHAASLILCPQGWGLGSSHMGTVCPRHGQLCVQAGVVKRVCLKSVMPTACEDRRGHAGVCGPAAESQPWPSDRQ